jgi:hypothetical protein
MGDFGAQVGNYNQDIEHIMGRHGMPCDKENENGQLLIELCGKHGLVIGGTVFPHKEGHKVTWISPDKDKQGRNLIYHICISRNWRKSLLDVRNKRGGYWVRPSCDHGNTQDRDTKGYKEDYK